MDHRIEEMKQKRKKLAFLLGEKLFNLYKSQGVRFLYTSDGVSEEEEINKLVRLMDYLEDRIKKFEEFYGEDEEDEASGDDDGSAEDGAEAVEESGEEKDQETAEAEDDEKKEPEDIAAVDAVPAGDPSSSCGCDASAGDEPAVQKDAAVAVADAGDELEDILRGAAFSSEAERRLFENSIQNIKNGSERDRELSIDQIAHISDKNALLKVYEFAMKNENSGVRAAIVKQISRTKGSANDGIIKMGLSDPDPKVKMAAIKALTGDVNDAHQKLLEGLLNDADPNTRGLAVTYLGIYYGKDGVNKAIEMCGDENPSVRKNLIEMLSIVKPEKAMTTIKHLLSDTDDEVRKAAEEALGKLMPERRVGKGKNDKRKKR